MSLYLCVFSGEAEVSGVEAGPYSDFNALREFVIRELEGGRPGSLYPAFILHPDSDGEWTAEECAHLSGELESIREAMRGRPPVPLPSQWQDALMRAQELKPANALECFLDVDGQPLVESLRRLVAVALRHGQPILFQ